MSASLRTDFCFNPKSEKGMLYHGLYQGIGVDTRTFFSSRLLGTPVSAYVYQGAPFKHFGNRLWLGYEWRFGAAFGWRDRSGDRDAGFLNSAISTRVTAHMGLGLKLTYALAPRWQLSLGFEATHFSNGNTSFPNSGINTIGLPGTIDLDIACTEYTIGFDTAINTAMQAIDKVRDTSSSHERCSIIEVMGRNAGYIALWCGIANGAEDILIPEKYDYNEQRIINNIIANRKRGKTHHIIINAEGIGHSTSMARRIEAATGIETRATILGYMQRGGSPTCKDRYYASIMGAYAADILCEGKTNRVVGYQHGEFLDFDIEEALNMKKDIPEYVFEVSKILSL